MADTRSSDASATGSGDAPGRVTDVTSPSRRTGSRFRRWMALALVVLSCIAILVSVLALWTHSLLFNTDRWVETVGPVGKDPQVTQDIGVYVTERAIQASDLEARVTEALPPRIEFLAPAITDAARNFMQERVVTLLRRPETYQLWLDLNRFAHEHLIAVLKGESTLVQIEGDQVQLNLVPIIARAMQLIEEELPGALGDRLTIPQIDPTASADEMRAQLTAATGRPLPPDFGTVVLFEGTQVSEAQRAVRIFEAAVIAIVVVTAALIAAALIFSPARLRTLVQLGLGTLIAIVIARFAVRALEKAVVDGLSQGGGHPIARSILESATDSLGSALVWVLAAAVVVTVTAFLFGRRDLFVAARGYAATAAAEASGQLATHQAPVRRWLGRHYDYARAGGVIVAVILLLFTTSSVWWTLLVVALAIAYEVVVWRWAEPGGSPPTTA